MKTEENEIKNYYLKEFSLFDGEYDVTFNILDVNTDKMTITVAITKAGKISVIEYDLKRDREQDLYFQYGVDNTQVNVNDFETIND
jgi:major membrane immunogen (membrane-anchored lipoprotein)